jgi:antitoxin (DNA-binding transcriptional repressor) of toxin-antitoxin stability system
MYGGYHHTPTILFNPEGKMFRKNRLFTAIVTCFFLLCFSVVGAASTATAKTPARDFLQVGQSQTLPYSGVLTNPDGKAVVDGKYDFIYSLYDAPENGNRLWTENQSGVAVKAGDFVTNLGQTTSLPGSIFSHKELWIEVSVHGPGENAFTLLSPRQMISTDAPAETTALSCPHSHFTDYWTGNVINYGLIIDNAGTGDGLRAYSNATAQNYAALYAYNMATTGYGSGVYGGSTNGNGVYAVSGNGDALEVTTAAPLANNKSAIYAHATNANGVWSVSTNRIGVYGNSTSSYGVSGTSTDNYAGYFYSTNFRGLYVQGNSGWYAAYIQNPSGSTNTGLYVDGTMWVTGAKTGFVVDIAINDGTEALETGDLVVITGYGDPVAGLIPVIKVKKADQAGSTAVTGVVDQPYSASVTQSNSNREPLGPTATTASKTDGTAIAPGGYLSVVTLGAYRVVKVDASFGSIKAGDMLVASSNPGYAMASADPKLGSVIGKALADWTSGTGLIPVMVTLK